MSRTRLQTKLSDKTPVGSVLFAPDGCSLVISCKVNLHFLDATTGVHVRLLETGHTRSIEQIAFAPNGQQLATASCDMTARLWDVATLECTVVLHGHEEVVSCVAYSIDGFLVATGSLDATVRLWRAADGRPMCSARP
eukprot:m.109353 g.109353  ORF g.109353 m.109353 type:complete len:138 (+) comp15887_c0_seq9:58-471(+)